MEFLKQHSNEIKPLKINNNYNNITVDNIINEYSLKRNNFNPSMKSPNHFANRLHQRMRLYYSSLTNC